MLFMIPSRKIKTLLISSTILTFSLSSHACEVASILFGDVRLDVVPYDGFETAIIRHNNFRNPDLNFGALKGEITVDRGGFSVRNTNHVAVGFITPNLEIQSAGDGCDTSGGVFIREAQPSVYVIINDNRPVGSIEGRFPSNDFGVQ